MLPPTEPPGSPAPPFPEKVVNTHRDEDVAGFVRCWKMLTVKQIERRDGVEFYKKKSLNTAAPTNTDTGINCFTTE
jgi:hypothetical protein